MCNHPVVRFKSPDGAVSEATYVCKKEIRSRNDGSVGTLHLGGGLPLIDVAQRAI